MAHHTATQKSLRQSGKRRELNVFRLTKMRNSCKSVEAAVEKKDAKTAQEALKEAQSDLARAVKNDVIKAGQASRKLSRLNAQVKALATGTSAAPAAAQAKKAPKKSAAKK